MKYLITCVIVLLVAFLVNPDPILPGHGTFKKETEGAPNPFLPIDSSDTYDEAAEAEQAANAIKVQNAQQVRRTTKQKTAQQDDKSINIIIKVEKPNESAGENRISHNGEANTQHPAKTAYKRGSHSAVKNSYQWDSAEDAFQSQTEVFYPTTRVRQSEDFEIIGEEKKGRLAQEDVVKTFDEPKEGRKRKIFRSVSPRIKQQKLLSPPNEKVDFAPDQTPEEGNMIFDTEGDQLDGQNKGEQEEATISEVENQPKMEGTDKNEMQNVNGMNDDGTSWNNVATPPESPMETQTERFENAQNLHSTQTSGNHNGRQEGKTQTTTNHQEPDPQYKEYNFAP